jgi:hypothetical protein
MAGVVTAVVALFVGHLDDEEQAAGDPGVDSASAMATSRSRYEGHARRNGLSDLSRVRRFFWAKAQRS